MIVWFIKDLWLNGDELLTMDEAASFPSYVRIQMRGPSLDGYYRISRRALREFYEEDDWQ